MKRLGWFAVAVAAGLGLARDAAAGGVMFDELADAFGTQPCAGGGCYTRYLRLADLDDDGDLEVLFANGGFGSEPLVVYDNDGSAGFTDVSATAIGGYTGETWQIAVGDVDGDGHLDIYAPDIDGGRGALFINDGTGTFDDEGEDRLPASSISVEATRFGDLDGDGDLDIVIAGAGAAVYLNDGTGVFDELEDAVPSGAGSDVNDIDLFDMDRDFDLDLLTNNHSGADRIWENDGTGTFSATDFSSSGGLHYGPGVCDVDDDGDLDIWIDNQGPSYTERLWLNDGTGDYTDVTAAQVTNNPSSDDNGIVCADVDSDGDFDAVVVALSTPERLLVNDGAGNFDYVAGAFSGPTDSSLWAEMGDLDGDGRLDIATGEGESGSFLNRVYLGTNLVPMDATAPRLIAAEDPPEDTLVPPETAVVRFAVSDDALSDHGPRLAAAFALLDPGGAEETVEAIFVGGDIFRVELPSEGYGGEVIYRLCATDLQDNTACTEDAVYNVEGGRAETGTGTGTGSSTGTGGSGDESDGSSGGTSGGEDTTGGATDNPSTSATASGTGPVDPSDSDTDGGSTGSAEGGETDGSGCGCRTSPVPAAWWLSIVLIALRRRR